LNGSTVGETIRREENTKAVLPEEFIAESAEVQAEVTYRVKYQGYLARERRQIEKFSHIEKIQIPSTLDYSQVRGLRKESALKLTEIRPATLGQAGRISGVNPADISILMVIIEASRRGKTAQ
jgi:tRNA uridine 5-carboxymethylaminomethyl modification enzyme